MSTPSLAAVLRRAIESRLAEVHVSIPARVQSYDAARRCVSVQPLIKRPRTGADGERTVERLPIISDVPVCFPGSGDYDITWPISRGDTVLLVFSEASIDAWLQSGGEVDPLDDRRNHLSDAIAIPGLRHLKSGGANASALVIAGDEVRLGDASASDPVALKSDLDSIKAAISGAAVGSADGGALFKTNILAAWPSSVGATKVKAT